MLPRSNSDWPSFRTRITTCYPDRVEKGPHFEPGLPHAAALARRPARTQGTQGRHVAAHQRQLDGEARPRAAELVRGLPAEEQARPRLRHRPVAARADTPRERHGRAARACEGGGGGVVRERALLRLHTSSSPPAPPPVPPPRQITGPDGRAYIQDGTFAGGKHLAELCRRLGYAKHQCTRAASRVKTIS